MMAQIRSLMYEEVTHIGQDMLQQTFVSLGRLVAGHLEVMA